MVQSENRYTVVMDVPLVPADQWALAQYLSEAGNIKVALELLSSQKMTQSLPLLDECEVSRHPHRQPGEFYPTVLDVVKSLGIKVDKSLADLCSKVHYMLTEDMVWIGKQYFRKTWLPILGCTLALLVVQVRAACFWDENKKDDKFTTSPGELCYLCGCSAKQLRRLYQDEEARKFFEVEESERGQRSITFRVRLIEPIASQDTAEYEGLLRFKLDGDQLEMPFADTDGACTKGNGHFGTLGGSESSETDILSPETDILSPML